MSPRPGIRIASAPSAVPPRAVVIVAQGGLEVSRRPTYLLGPISLWQWYFTRALRPVAVAYDAELWRLRYRYRGWNGDDQDAARDVEWAVAQARQQRPGVPIILIGQSMGGRAVLYAAAAEGVTAVCALSPWIEPGDPIDQLVGKPVLIAHGVKDRITDPRLSRSVAERVGAAFVPIDDGHTMLLRWRRWIAVVSAFLRSQLS